MPAPPLAELYDLLRAEDFAIGVDDHVRIGRLLACDAAWTPELLRTAVAALVVTDPGERDAFDACWARWMRGEPARRVLPVARAKHALPATPAVSAPPMDRAEPRGEAPPMSLGERSPAAEAEASRSSAETPRAARPSRRRAIAVVTVAVAVAVALVLARWLGAGEPASGRGPGKLLAGKGSSQLLDGADSGSSHQLAGTGSGSSQLPGGKGSGSSPQHAGLSSETAGAGLQPGGTASGSAGAGLQPGGTASGSASAGLQPGGTASGSAGAGLQRGGTASGFAGTGLQPGGSAGAGLQPGGTGTGSTGASHPAPPAGAVLDLVLIPIAIGAIGAIVLASLTIMGLREARGRRRFLPGPWRYVVAVPQAVRPLLSRRSIEDATADLTWRAPGAGREFDVARSIAATVERGGRPTLVHDRQAAAPRYLVLEDTAGGAGRWQPIYDELLSGLAREGVVIERYRFAANPERCLRPDGHAVPFGELIDHADALIVIGDADAAVDPLGGRRAGWVASLRQIPRRLWINPVPPVRWSAGARVIAEDTPMQHGVARAVAALHLGSEGRGRPARPYPAVIERAPDTESAVAGLRAALGDPVFHLVSAVAVTAPPTLAAARWLAEVLALGLDEQDWLAVATLPWFRTGAWPDGLRDRLSQALDAGAPDLARAVAAVADDRLAASEPPRGSAAHLAWQLEGAVRAARRGERGVADRSLRRVAATPLAGQALRARAVHGLPDRARRARGWALAIGVALVVAPAAYCIAAALQWPADGTAARAATAGLRCPLDMVTVPAGTFRMGSPAGQGYDDEQPAHDVTLSAYCMDRTEVTVSAYAACVQAGKCTAAEEPAKTGGGRFCNGTRADRQDHPINCVDWNQAGAYCAWAGRRLPSEAEWEYAARGTDGRTYSWGDDPPSARHLNACGRECVARAKREPNLDWSSMYDGNDGWESTAPVGSFPAGASPFGALDMAGNAWEWTADWYDSYLASAVTNPPGAGMGTARVLRGGGWNNHDSALVRAAFRLWAGSSFRSGHIGFRCARWD